MISLPNTQKNIVKRNEKLLLVILARTLYYPFEWVHIELLFSSEW